jgi:hypothetical protein
VSAGSPPLEPWETDEWQWLYEHRQVATEEDWFSCPNPGAILDYVNQHDAASPRKFFLAGAACVRRIWNLLERPESRAAVEAAEQFADGYITREQLRAISFAAAVYDQWPANDPRSGAALAAGRLRHDIRQNHGNAEETMYVLHDIPNVVALTAGAEGSDERAVARITEMRAIADIYRCVMGNPFRSIPFSHEWRTDTALTLARTMYEARDFGAMPILADAIQDAGCDQPAILDHCRDANQVHVRGCWVVDLVLGKE